MKRKHCISFLLFVLANFGSTASECEYKTVDDFTRSLPANPTRQIQIAEGDLNGDGLIDRGILTDDGDGKTHQLYILLQNKIGVFSLAQSTKRNEGFWQAVYVSIEKGSLFVDIEGASPTSGAKHQFKLYRGIWRLIGLRYSSVTGSTGDGGVASNGYDWNVLTGDVVQSDDKAGKLNNKRSKWPAEICKLEDYDFDPTFCTPTWKANRFLHQKLSEPNSIEVVSEPLTENAAVQGQGRQRRHPARDAGFLGNARCQ